jgi:death-on-curing family protein
MIINEVINQKKYIELLQTINRVIKEAGIIIDTNKIAGVLGSLDYYISTKEKIACLIRSIIKNHEFTNGNKRTAAAFYLAMCKHMNYTPPFNNQEFAETFIDIAKNNYSVEQITAILFP